MFNEFFMASIFMITFLISYTLLYGKLSLNKVINNKIIMRFVFLCTALAFSIAISFLLDNTDISSTYNLLIKSALYGPVAALILYLFPIGSITRRP